LLIAIQAGIVKNTHTAMFKAGSSGKEVCDRSKRASEVGSKNGIQNSRENICKIYLLISI